MQPVYLLLCYSNQYQVDGSFSLDQHIRGGVTLSLVLRSVHDLQVLRSNHAGTTFLWNADPVYSKRVAHFILHSKQTPLGYATACSPGILNHLAITLLEIP